MKMEKHKAPAFSRRALFVPESFNEDQLTVDVVFATENPVRTWHPEIGWFNEILSCQPDHANLERFEKGAGVLDNHNLYGSVKEVVLGVTYSPRFQNKEGITSVRLSRRDENKGVVLDVKDGILRNTSVGYKVLQYVEETMPGDEVRTLRAVKWNALELSFTPVNADPGSQTRSKKEEAEYEFEIISREDSLKTRTEGTEPVTEPAAEPAATPATEPATPASTEPAATPAAEPQVDPVEAEQARCLEINDTCQRHGLKPEFARKLITDKVSIDKARKLIIDQIAEEKPSMHQNNNVTVVVDEREKKRTLAEHGLSLRLGLATGEIPNEARAYRNLTLVEVAKELDSSLRGLAKKDIAARAMHSTSDFPLLFGNVANKSLMKSYNVAPKTYLPFVNKVSLPDFKEASKINFGTAPQLKQIAEGGEYEFGTIGEGAEKYRLSKYGRKIRITEEMFINDDLGALQSLPGKFGNSSAALESAIVYGILTGNPNMADGVALFHATHKNLGTAGAPSETTFDEMVQKFLEQKDGEQLLNILPKYIIGGPKNRTALMKMLASLNAVGKSGDVNIFQNAYDLIIDANIQDKSWFASADPAQTETIDVGYLDGMEGPEVKSIADEANDSILLKCKHIFVAKAVDYKGLFKNPYV